MSCVIVLSDSDEPASPVNKRDQNGCVNEINEKYDSDVTSDIDFPEVPFCRRTEDSTSQSEENIYDPNVNDDPKHRRSSYMSDSYDSEDNPAKKTLRKTATKKKTTTSNEERIKRQQIAAREKALRAIASKKSRDMKPGECIKFMEVNLDQGIDAFSCTEIQGVLRDANVQFHVTTESIPNSITWRRNIVENYVSESNKVRVRRSVQTEKYVIVVWSSYEAVKHIADDTFCESVLSCKALIPDYNMTLVIFGMKDYFAHRKKAKEKSSQSSENKRSKGSNKNNQQFETLPTISRQQLEMCLTEAQIVARCSSRLIEDAQDLALMVYQYTKSISEIPYKVQKKESQENMFEWYVMGDNRNTVRVDKDGNGLKRLWQQQLCQFNLCSLETAEAICTIYPSPARLIEVLFSCKYVYFIPLSY